MQWVHPFTHFTSPLPNPLRMTWQPVVAFDWHPQREGLCALSALDQTLRVFLVTKLNHF